MGSTSLFAFFFFFFFVVCIGVQAGGDQPTFDSKKARFIGLHPGRFAGKVCFITGATSGLGEHAAYHLASEGCAVVVTGRREEKGAAVVDHVINTIKTKSTLKPAALFIKVDVTAPEELRSAVAQIEATYGRLDAVFANAGISYATPVGDDTDDNNGLWKTLIDVNVNGVFYTINSATPLMKKTGGGAMVLCSSIYGLRASPHMSAYAASKHAVEGLKESSSAELFPFGIRVNNINPSFTPSEIVAPYMNFPPFANLVKQIQPDEKMSEMGEVSAGVAYLLSHDSQYVNGHSLPIDGGLVSQMVHPPDWVKAFDEVNKMVAAMTAGGGGDGGAAATDENPSTAQGEEEEEEGELVG